MSLSVDHLELGPLGTNCYLVESAGRLLVVDPASDADVIERAVAGRPVDVIAITHCHWDHIQAVSRLAGSSGAAVVVHEADADALSDLEENGSGSYGFDPGDIPIARRLSDGDVVEVGQACFAVLHTPGHSAGSMCLYEPREHVLFSGDTLFSGGSVGRTDLGSGSRRDIVRSVTEKLAPLPDDVVVYPGHGASSTIGAERVLNPLLRPR